MSKTPIQVEVNVPQAHKPAVAATKAAGLVDASHEEPSGSKKAVASGEVVVVTSVCPELEAVLKKIAKILESNHAKIDSVASIGVAGVKLMLSSWEVAAFVQGGDETADALQSAVAARALLLSELERRKKSEPAADVAMALQAAQSESAKIQTRITAAKQAKDIDAAVNLAATSKRLLAVLDEAAKPVK